MRMGARVANWPLAWKVPLLAAGLLIGVAFVISQTVLNRLESDQENNLRHLTSAYLDGLSTAVLRSAIHADVWETFDALDRARDRYAGLKVRFAIVALPNGKVLAASDPLKFPVQSSVPVDIDERFPTQDGLTIDAAIRPGVAHSLSPRGRLFGRTHSGGDRHFRVASRTPASGADLGRSQRWPRARLCHFRLLRPPADAQTPERTQRIR